MRMKSTMCKSLSRNRLVSIVLTVLIFISGIHFLPIEKLQTPRDEILIRKIDPIFLEKLQKDMEMEPEVRVDRQPF